MPFAIAAAAIGVGSQIGGAVLTSNAATGSANTQSAAANQASQQELGLLGQTQQGLQPYVQGGQQSLASLLQGLGIGGNPNAAGYGSLVQPFTAQQYQQSPGYQFQMQQGTQAINNAASATGGIAGGNTLKALQTYGQGLANSDYYQAMQAFQNQQSQQYAKLAGTAGLGLNAAGNAGQYNTQVGGMVGLNDIGAGNAQAAGQVSSANAYSGLLGSLFGGGTGSGASGAGSGASGAGGQGTAFLTSIASLFSDERLKTDIKEIAETEDGLPIYSFRYKGSPATTIGLMAQDVEKVKPEAVSTHPSGFKMVNYMRALALKKAA